MSDTTITVYDQSDFCKNFLYEKIDEIKKLCVANNIPFAFVLAEKNDANGTKYYMDGAFVGSMDYHLTDDKITDFLAILNGFKAYPKRTDFLSQEDMEYIEDFSLVEEDEL